MTDGGKPARSTLEQALIEQPKLCGAILIAAKKRGRSLQEAEDLAQEATTHAIVRSRATGEPKPPPLTVAVVLMFIGSILNSMRATTFRSERRKPPPVGYDEADPKHTASAALGPERLLHDHARERDVTRMEAELREHLAAHDPEPTVSLGMLDWAAKGVVKNDEFAEKLECQVEQVRTARRRLANHGAQVRQRVLGDEGAPS
jgi:hypothetical protein